MTFLGLFERLLPRAKSLGLVIDRQLRQLFDGLTGMCDNAREYIDLTYLDIFPQTTRELDLWEAQWGLQPTVTNEQERRDRLEATWSAVGGQSPRYIQDTLRDAGFDVYIHEWWQLPVVGSPSPRDPTAVLSDTDLLVNKGFAAVDTPLNVGASAAQCGGVDAEVGGSTTVYIEGGYTVPTDSQYWPYMLYIGDQTFPDRAEVDILRKPEFEALCRKICPAQQWLGLLVDFV